MTFDLERAASEPLQGVQALGPAQNLVAVLI